VRPDRWCGPQQERALENLIFRGGPDEHNACDQWTLVKDADDEQDYVVQEHVKLDALLSGKP
jgi:hypothetical protein